MPVPSPHYLLFSEAHTHAASHPEWRFVLESVNGSKRIAAADCEPETRGERLELLAVVRGLEALAQPSRVTLVTKSRYVSRGLERGLGEWRENGWRWERFGRLVPVRDADLWRRVDRAMGFHRIRCRTWRFDVAERRDPPPPKAPANRPVSTVNAVDPGARASESPSAVMIAPRRPTNRRRRWSLPAAISLWWRRVCHLPNAAVSH